ncbi:type IX secretion system sortase PorU [Riemerella columbina]|uniref:type IX secretion system sortase PorU n=1 Tax=Riemerella columbina TaxID=103810 RepID=UPI00037C82C3|nr:type IX secretion system sortase PorU [Riemerella columbina]
MKKYLAFLFSIVFISQYYTQNYKIHWEGIHTISYSENENIILPGFTNEHFAYENGQVYLQNSKKLDQNQNFSITNTQWEKLPREQWYDLDAQQITPNEDYNLNTQVSKFGILLNYNIKVIKKERGELYKLVEYTLVPQKKQPFKTTGLTPMAASTESPLKSGNFYKIKVDKTGVYKITSEFLRNLGIDPKSINPKNLRIYGNGGLMLPEFNQDFYYRTLQENAIEVVGENDNQWDDQDYALFYAQGPNGYKLYNRGNARIETRDDRSSNVTNIYEDAAYYFITFDKGLGKRITTETDATPSTFSTTYNAYQFINEDKTNFKGLGRLWVGEAFNQNREITFNLKEPINTSDIVQLRVRVISNDAENAKINLNIGTQQLTRIAGKDLKSIIFETNVDQLSGNIIKLTLNPDISPNPNALFYLDYAEIDYPQPLKFNDAQLAFRDYNIYESSGNAYGFEISNATGIDRVWNVADVTQVTRKNNLSSSNQTFRLAYTANSTHFNNEFIAFKIDAAYTPQAIGRIPNQNLHGDTDTDYLIITIPEFFNEAQRLANYHETHNGFKVKIVAPETIYNEYSSGSQDITAIRNFVSHLKNNGSLKYVFILGDTSYDYKNRIPNNTNIVPSYQSEFSFDFSNSYVTDDYFTMVKPQYSTKIISILPDLPVGRLPAQNLAEAKILIDKTLAYYNALPNQSTPFGVWKMNMDFVVDDDKDGGTPFHTVIDHILEHTFETGTDKKEYHIRKLYLDAFSPESSAGGQRYPAITQGITNAMNNSLFLMYFGHGGINGWAQERVLTLSDIIKFDNFNSTYSQFPLVSTITCEFTLWDNPNINSAGEALMKLKGGGPANMITSSRELSVDYGKRFSETFLEHILKINASNTFNRLGDAFLDAKLNYGIHSGHLKVNFLGDPAMPLTRPQPKIVVDQITIPDHTSIRALDFIKVKGHIIDDSGSNDTNFNGKVTVNLFDKFQNKKTKNNDGNLTPILSYKEEGNPIVKSSGTAENGVFELEFYVPKDIDFSIGDGRMLLYADNKTHDVYHSQNVKVGGINPNGIDDNEPPKIKLYMNNTNFADGGITNENPILLACLTDDTGINATGAGIGHDITVVLDGEVINTKVLNDYFTPGEDNGCISANLKDYQKGTVNYPFKNLKPGEHQLVLKVWDINNNSATASLNFIVRPQSEENLVVKRLLNWPNPFTNKTYIQFEHNCPDVLDVTAQIYTITGKLVKTIHQTVSSEPFREGFRTGKYQIEWDGTDNYGATVGKGSYIYKVFVKSSNQSTCKGSTTQIEKMILLK